MTPLRNCTGMICRFLIVSLLILSGCGGPEDQRENARLSVTDDIGKTVTLPAPARRIISLAPSITETLFALGLDSKVVGITSACDYPEVVTRIPRVGGMTSPNYERIVDTNPDLIVMTVSGNSGVDHDKLVSLGLNVFVTGPRTMEGIFRSIKDLGRLTGRTASADSIVYQLRSQQHGLTARAVRQREKSVLLLFSLRPVISAGGNTFVDELIQLANGVNVTRNAPTSYPLLSREEILKIQPDVIVVTNDIARSIDDVADAYPEWKSLKAVQHRRVSIIDASLISRPGPRIVEGLEALVTAIHF